MSGKHTPLIISLFRLIRLLLHLARGVFITIFILPQVAPTAREVRVQRWCGQLLRILAVRVRVTGKVPDREVRRTLFVANHVSWLDIWVLKQLRPVQFVAKAEIRAWPVVGWLAARTGTLFITRENRRDTARAAREVKEALMRGDNLCFFPEGTTTDGTELRPFKPSLFQGAIDAGAQVWPLAIHYPLPDGETNTAVAYCGDITMAGSLWTVLRQREIVVELHFAEPLPPAGDRRGLAQAARKAIACRLPPLARKAPGTSDDPPGVRH